MMASFGQKERWTTDIRVNKVKSWLRHCLHMSKVIGPVYQADNLDGLETSSDTNPRRPRQTKDERLQVTQGNDATSKNNNW